ncbi:hypothetical protein EVAR_25662_1 [Eumeta japonica]|uniref:Uncharacterized protein n=1 Tax=Eumeta variegata TaxID=151549 RepID=A0A4C1WDL1_EUMVA|nr:hypothetical protein EVAR_25662_1 [Eumeta japonica]
MLQLTQPQSGHPAPSQNTGNKNIIAYFRVFYPCKESDCTGAGGARASGHKATPRRRRVSVCVRFRTGIDSVLRKGRKATRQLLELRTLVLTALAAKVTISPHPASEQSDCLRSRFPDSK